MGRLVYVMGASGVGKDTLLDAVRLHYPDWLVAHRYVTRDSAGTENSVAVTPEEFAARRRQGLFCLTWHAHGLDYGLGIEIETWLARDHTILVNGSRHALPEARQRLGKALLPLLITAPEAVLAERLRQRGREDAEQVEARLVRHRELSQALPEVARLDNGGALVDTLSALRAWLAEECRS